MNKLLKKKDKKQRRSDKKCPTSLVPEVTEDILAKVMEQGMDAMKASTAKVIKVSLVLEIVAMEAPTMEDLEYMGTTVMGNQLWINIKMTKNPIKKHRLHP